MQPAVVNYGPQPLSVELREVPVPAIGPDEVLLQVRAVGVCGSDVHMWQGQQSWPVRYPVILGHEFAGQVHQVGSGVAGWKPGDRVVSETHAAIRPNSPLSRRGWYHLDPERRGFGAGVDGAMTRFVAVPARILHRLPDNVPWHHAALSEPCCVAYNATILNSRIHPGDRIVVLGPGPIGLLCAAMARLCGAEVAVVGLPRDESRLKIARQYGCEPMIGDARDWALAVDGLGADGVVDATGVSAPIATALELVRPGGWITKVGWGREPVDRSLDALVQKNVRLQGSFSHYWPVWERVLRLLATGMLDVSPLVGGQWPLEHWEEAFQTMHEGRIAKAVLLPQV